MPSVYPPLRTCSRCEKEQPATIEYFSVTKKGAATGHCRTCIRELAHDWYHANKERGKASRRAWRQMNAQKVAAHQKDYYIEHRERILAQTKARREADPDKARLEKRLDYQRHKERRIRAVNEWCAKNVERIRAAKHARYKAHQEEHYARSRAWARAHPAEQRAKWHRRRARERGAEGSHTPADVTRQRAAQKERCWWCDALFTKTRKPTIDHLVPLVRGGSNWPDNIVMACLSCNSRRSGKMPHEWCGRLF